MRNKRDDIEEIDSVDERVTGSEKVKSGIKFARFLLLLIAVLSALILLFANRNKINIDNFKRLASKIDLDSTSAPKDDMTEINFDYDSGSVVAVYKDGIARVTEDNLSIIDNIGTQFQSVLTGFNSPALITNQKYALTYDRGGNKLIITNSFSTLFEKTFEDNIVDVSMNEDGYFTVITESEAYKNKLVVFDDNFKEIYKFNSMKRYIVSADISNDNKHLALSCIYIENDKVIPQIVYHKLTSEESIWSCDFNESIAVSVKAKNDGTVCAIFEWGICLLDSKGNEKYRYEFGNKILQSFYISDGKYNAIAFSESMNGKSEVYVFDNNGKQIADIKCDFTVTSIDMCGDRMAVASLDKLCVFTATGKQIYERNNPNGGVTALFSDKNAVLTISSSGIIYNVIN